MHSKLTLSQPQSPFGDWWSLTMVLLVVCNMQYVHIVHRGLAHIYNYLQKLVMREISTVGFVEYKCVSKRCVRLTPNEWDLVGLHWIYNMFDQYGGLNMWVLLGMKNIWRWVDKVAHNSPKAIHKEYTHWVIECCVEDRTWSSLYGCSGRSMQFSVCV